MHTMVVARENPNLEAQVLEVTLLTKIDEWGPGVGLPVSKFAKFISAFVHIFLFISPFLYILYSSCIPFLSVEGCRATARSLYSFKTF